MNKLFLYNFNGTISIQANTEDKAEKLVTGINLNDYLIDEDLYEVDESYIPTDLDKRIEQRGTELHPLDDPAEYEQYKMRKCRYSRIFSQFLNGKIDRQEMIKKMEQAENKDIPKFQPLHIADPENKKGKDCSACCCGLVERSGFDDLAMMGVRSEIGNNRCFR
jgi:hypothetical protein